MSHYDPLDLRSQENAQADAASRDKLAAQIELDDFKWLMSSKRGRRVVWRLLERTGVYRSSFTGNSETYFREGMRNVGLMLMAQIHTAGPNLYAAMVQEQEQVKHD
jgi:hypothetical protein